MKPVFVNRNKFETDAGQLTGREILAIAGLGEGYDLFQLQGEGDRTGGAPIGLDQTVLIKAGLHFRAIPTDRNFGTWLFPVN